MADEQGKKRSECDDPDAIPGGETPNAQEPEGEGGGSRDPSEEQPKVTGEPFGGDTGTPAPAEAPGLDEEGNEPRVTITRSRLNRLSLGTLTVHYRTRSVSFSLDGDSAMRLLAVLVGHRHDRTLDVVAPDSVSAFRSWVMVDSTEVIGADWNPLPEPARVAVDPPNESATTGLRRLLYEGRVDEEDLLGLPFAPLCDQPSEGVGAHAAPTG